MSSVAGVNWKQDGGLFVWCLLVTIRLPEARNSGKPQVSGGGIASRHHCLTTLPERRDKGWPYLRLAMKRVSVSKNAFILPNKMSTTVHQGLSIVGTNLALIIIKL